MALRRSAHLAMINALEFERTGEEEILEAFACQLNAPAAAAPMLPAWSALRQCRPEFVRQFREAVANL